MNKKFPPEILRGISNASFIVNGKLTIEAYPFGQKHSNDFKEESVTWYDDEFSWKCICNQRGSFRPSIQFCKIAIINRIEIDDGFMMEIQAGLFKYIREPTIDNPSHGEFLLSDSLSKSEKKHIRTRLCDISSSNIQDNPVYKHLIC